MGEMLDQMDDTQRKVAVYAAELLERQKGVRKAQVALRMKSKQAEADGVSWPEVRDALRDYNLSRAAREDRLKRQAEIYTSLGAPAQLELFDAFVALPNDTESEAWRKGWFAAIIGQIDDPPWEPGTVEGQAWLSGINDFHSVRAAIERERESQQQEKAEA